MAAVIGVDLDNTIICYDTLFHRLALERGFISENTPALKRELRQSVAQNHGDEAWQHLQALAYGPKIHLACIFPNVREAFLDWKNLGLKLVIISHKTRLSSKGDYELRRAALAFLERQGILCIIDAIQFVSSIERKIQVVKALACHVFIDDLPKVLLRPSFPEHTKRILFNPSAGMDSGLISCRDWLELNRTVKDEIARDGL
jgi:hypothetical protein